MAHSTLTAWFRYNSENADGRATLYQDFPYRYTFVAKTRQWQRRIHLKDTVIDRMYYCSPVAGERYYLLSEQGYAIQWTRSRELSELRKSTKFHLYN
jgi:hypothetical protein